MKSEIIAVKFNAKFFKSGNYQYSFTQIYYLLTFSVHIFVLSKGISKDFSDAVRIS